MGKTTILLTGGSGMVGRNFLERASIEDFIIFAPSSGQLDLRDFKAVQKYLERHRPDLIIHAAGKVGGIQANMREPVAFLTENLDMGRNIVCAARQAGVQQLINLGSSCMYPRNITEPLREEMVLKGELEPTNEGYALAKVVTARLCEYISRENPDFRYKTLIPCNLYGRHDKFDPANSHLIPAIIHKIDRAIRDGSKAVEIWGNGQARREFMFAEDLADALVRAVLEFETLPSLMNLGLGYDYSINEYYQVVAEVMGYQGEFVHDLTKPVGMARKLVNVDCQQAWGWRASHSLREGIDATYKYYLESLK